MKTQRKAKDLQDLPQEKLDKGFPFLEVTIALIIVGILGAIALPSLIGCGGGKGKQSEAKNTISAINKTEIAYYTDLANTKKQGYFTDSIQKLDIGLPQETTNYRYKIVIDNAKYPSVMSTAIAKDKQLKNYIGGVFFVKNSKESRLISVLCESNTAEIQPNKILVDLTTPQKLQCPPNYKPL